MQAGCTAKRQCSTLCGSFTRTTKVRWEKILVHCVLHASSPWDGLYEKYHHLAVKTYLRRSGQDDT